MNSRNISVATIIILILIIVFLNEIGTNTLGCLLGFLAFLQVLILIKPQVKKSNKLIIHDYRDPHSSSQNILAQIEKNYTMYREHTEIAFVVSLVMSVLGFVIIALASYSFFKEGISQENNSLTLISGIIVEFISGTALYFYQSNFKQLKKSTNRLELTMSYIMLFDRCKNDKQLDFWFEKFRVLINEDT